MADQLVTGIVAAVGIHILKKPPFQKRINCKYYTGKKPFCQAARQRLELSAGTFFEIPLAGRNHLVYDGIRKEKTGNGGFFP